MLEHAGSHLHALRGLRPPTHVTAEDIDSVIWPMITAQYRYETGLQELWSLHMYFQIASMGTRYEHASMLHGRFARDCYGLLAIMHSASRQASDWMRRMPSTFLNILNFEGFMSESSESILVSRSESCLEVIVDSENVGVRSMLGGRSSGRSGDGSVNGTSEPHSRSLRSIKLVRDGVSSSDFSSRREMALESDKAAMKVGVGGGRDGRSIGGPLGPCML